MSDKVKAMNSWRNTSPKRDDGKPVPSKKQWSGYRSNQRKNANA
jgi:hypothetical protein